MSYTVDKVLIKPQDDLYVWCYQICTNSAHMYNAALFQLRQCFSAYGKETLAPLQEEAKSLWNEHLPQMHMRHPNWQSPFDSGKLPSYAMLNALFVVSHNPDYYADGFPAQTAQHCIKSACAAFDSYFKGRKSYEANPAKFSGKPKLPKYRKGALAEATLSNQDCVNRDGVLKLPRTSTRLKCRPAPGKLKEAKVVPFHDCFYVILTYEVEDGPACRKPERIASIDFGVNNLAAVANNTGSEGLLFSGRALKSIREKESKALATLASRQTKGKKATPIASKQSKRILTKTALKTDDYLHKTASAIIDWCLSESIDTIVVGSNKNWKQECDMGHHQNRMFGRMPFDRLKWMLQYRCEREGINYIETEESYTSKASFYDQDAFDAVHFTGKRSARGCYKCANGEVINADLNGAANIGRKVFPELFTPENVDIRTMKAYRHPDDWTTKVPLT